MLTLDTVDLRLLRVFIAVVDAGGLAAAEPELGIALSTISNHITALETRLGLTLCRRGRGGFKLSPDGEAVHAEARRLLAAADGFGSRVSALKKRLSGTLVIGQVDNTITDPAAPLDRVFARLAEAAPGLALHIVTRSPNELLRDVADGQVAVAIGSFPRLTLGLDYVDLYSERHSFYLGHHHALWPRAEEEIAIEEIRRHRLVSRTYWGARDLKPFSLTSAAAVVGDMEAAARLILSGAFMGYLPTHYAGRWASRGELKALRPAELSYDALFQIAHTHEGRTSAPVKLFRQIVIECFRARTAALPPATPAGRLEPVIS
ncbi:LysR family transcriptional regulator [Radicibacter daui]|uniref:LysR family transcriptional regulator n=1 Tax=Radicibacter daui TaxID=3064829 RepID=UPI004046B923